MDNRTTQPMAVPPMGLKRYYPVGFIINLMIILIFGLLMLFSASYTTGYLRFDDSYHFIRSQVIFAVFGIFVMLVAAQFNYHNYKKFAIPGYILSLILLMVVLTCEPINGCRRWLHWPNTPLDFIPSIQVSEIVKFVIILCTAQTMIRVRRHRNHLWYGLCLPALWLIPVLILLFLEPHLSGMVLMIMIVGSMLLLGGNGFVWIMGVAGACVGVFTMFPKFFHELTSYAGDRLEGWTSEFENMLWQTQQSLLAIGSGGLTGLGIGNSMEKQLWLPECTNDFIFSILCEELGFLGAAVVILLFLGLIFQSLYIAYNASDLYGTLIALGITAQITWQVFFNIAVVTNTVPNTGISLPFFSSGGTSLVLLMGEMGVMLNIARQGTRAQLQRKAKKEAAQQAAQTSDTKEN